MPNEFEELAAKAAQMADEQFKSRLSGLTKLTDADVSSLITQTGISNEDLARVLHEVKTATAGNEVSAQAIQGISKGVGVLVAIAKKFI